MSISLDGISSLYTSEYTQANDSTTKLESTLNNTNVDSASDEKLMEVCKEFESYLLEQVFKEMKKTVLKDDDESELGSCSKTLEYFEDTLVQEYASMATEKCDLGIAKQMYEQMKRNYNL